MGDKEAVKLKKQEGDLEAVKKSSFWLSKGFLFSFLVVLCLIIGFVVIYFMSSSVVSGYVYDSSLQPLSDVEISSSFREGGFLVEFLVFFMGVLLQVLRVIIA